MAILYALTRGFLDDIPVEDISRFESEYYTWLEHNRKEILDTIRETGKLPDEEEFNTAIEDFKKTFVKSEK